MKKKIVSLAMFVSSLVFILVFVGCVSAAFDTKPSQKAINQNIKVVTSERMVEGMTMIHAYTETILMANSLQGIANKAGNKAADDGYSDITVLVVQNSTSPQLFEVSYWE
jgi:hypothetical protein